MRVNDIILCECCCVEHQMIFQYDDEPNWENVYITYHLQKKDFWSRFKHLFGYKSIYGDFGEIILGADDNTIKKFENVVKHLKMIKEVQEKKQKEFEENKQD